MNNNKKLTRHGEEFKQSSVKLALESDQPIARTAKDLGIKENTLYGWVTKYRHRVEGLGVARTGNQEELSRLRRENARLRQERDILKKALQIQRVIATCHNGSFYFSGDCDGLCLRKKTFHEA